MCDEQLCEETDWFFGTKGVCNSSTGLCDCPEGFSGEDNWQPFNDCHIDVSIRDSFNLAYLGMSIFTATVLLLVAVYLFIKWQFLEDMIVGIRKASQPGDRSQSIVSRSNSKTEGMSSPRPSFSLQGERVRFVSKRQRLILMIILILLLYPSLALPYSIYNSNGSESFRYNRRWIPDLSLAISSNFLFCGYWIILLVYYKSLPDVVLLGKLLNLKSLFVSFPSQSGIYRLTVVHVILITLADLLLLGFIPSIYFDDHEVRKSCNRGWVIFTFAAMGEFLLVFEGVCYLISRLYKEALSITGEETTGNKTINVRKVKRGLDNVRIMAFGVPIIISVGSIPLAILLTSFGERHVFAVFLFAAVAGYSAAILASIVFARELTNKHASSFRDVMKAGSLISKEGPVIHKI